MNLHERITRSIFYIIALAVIIPGIQHGQVTGRNDTTFVSYNLEVGKRLFYTSRTKFSYTKGNLESHENLEIWVLKHNPDGSRRLLLRYKSYTTKIDKKGKAELLSEDFAEAFCSFFPNGHFTRNWALDNLTQFDLFLPNIFIRLPHSFSEEALDWEFTDRLFGGGDYYTADKPNPDERSWVVQVTYETPLDEVYLMHQTAAVYLDVIKGIPIYAKGEGIRGYGTYAGRSTKTVLLDSIVKLDTLWARRYARDLELFLSTDSTYNHILSKAELYPAKLMPLRADAESLLAHASKRITTPELRDQLQNVEDNLPEDFKRVTEGIRKRAKFVNKKSQRWTAEDFDDQSHSLDDYQGKVILLDFWYRGCPWCIRAMSQIDQIAQHYKDKPVVVLGINVDKKLEDALLVIEKLKPGYTNLKGRDLIKKYGIEGYPTFVIIDQNGFVRRIYVGYEPNLYQRLVEMIDVLL
jgi:thiol-disulfide isomerase/thioredoxin